METVGKPLTYLSLFSGVEAASLAWEALGWKPTAFAEVAPFPSAVLADRWPDVPNPVVCIGHGGYYLGTRYDTELTVQTETVVREGA